MQSLFAGTLHGKLHSLARRLEGHLDSDVLAIVGPIYPGAERKVRYAIESNGNKRPKLAVVLQTPGGVVEVTERMVDVIRNHYSHVTFAIPDVAMSAGTVFAMSGDVIMMNYYSCLGPIDPQLLKGDQFVPALSYLIQYERLVQKSMTGALSNAEAVMLLNKFDPAELHKYEEARELSVSLLVKWLARYKFKDWTQTETQGLPVSQAMREVRAADIARALIDPTKWHSHGRGINMGVLINELNLKIDDFGKDKVLERALLDYFKYIEELMAHHKMTHLVHSKNYL